MFDEQNATEALAKLAEITADELDKRGENGDTVLIEEIAFSNTLTMPKLQGGWGASFCGRFEEGCLGSVFLVPLHTYTRGMWEKGQIKNAIEAGLSPEHATNWIRSKAKYKHRLLQRLVNLISDSEKQAGYAAYQRSFTTEEYQRWSARTGITDRLSPSLRMALIRLFEEVTGSQLCSG